MPIIVDEIVISVEVANQNPGIGAPSPSSSKDRQTVINECVERVLDVLKRKTEP